MYPKNYVLTSCTSLLMVGLRLCFGLGGAAQLCEQLGPAAVEHGVAEEARPARHLRMYIGLGLGLGLRLGLG